MANMQILQKQNPGLFGFGPEQQEKNNLIINKKQTSAITLLKIKPRNKSEQT